MNMKTPHTIAALITIPVCLATLLFGQEKDEEDEIFELSPFEVSTGGYGVTAGGAQDIGYTRSQIAMGNIPRPSTFTAEGLFSEYDLPLKAPSNCSDLICVYGEAMTTELPSLPEATHLAQIGFASGIDAAKWERAPLNLIAVVDKSGSMSGRPLNLVRESLLEVLGKLDERDQLSIVLYGDRSHIYLEPTQASTFNKGSIRRSIQGITSAGSTNMESGLRVGYALADQSAPDFKGNTRLMLFTDERPNTGNTSEAGFMGQMREGSTKGYGLTTIGVGTNFGAELANAISSVRGGNLFFFPDASAMQEKFTNEFETMVTELAYDMTLTLTPAKGFKIAGVFGIPGDMLKWTEDERSLYMEVETLFLSLRKGAIYFALAPETPKLLGRSELDKIKNVAQASLSCQMGNQNFPITQNVALRLKEKPKASIGLLRGEALIDEYTSLKKATTLYHEDGDTVKAHAIVEALSNRFKDNHDSAIHSEKKLIKEIERNLAIVAENDTSLFEGSEESPLVGSWIAYPKDNSGIEDPTVIRFHANRIMEYSVENEYNYMTESGFAITDEKFGKGRRGQLRFVDEDEAFRLAEINDTVNELTESKDYIYDVARIVYKVRGDYLTLSIYDQYNDRDRYLVLKRQSGEPKSEGRDQRVEIEPATGLPKRI